jgi:glyoxylase-like metal-dependent hydrolase (beta-lactamase superfamily II)
MKKLVAIVIVAALAAFGWWYAFDGSTPAESDFSFRLDELRAAAAAAPAERPETIAVEVVGKGSAPAFAAIGGFDFTQRNFDYAAFRIGYADGRSVVVDTAVDENIAVNILRGAFDRAAYDRMIAGMAAADTILVTHEHIDHLPVVARYPDPAAIAPKLRLTAPEIAALPGFAQGGKLPPQLAALQPADFARPTRIAPGIAALQTPGHTAGHIVVYVRTASGAEYLMVGDIVWLMDSVTRAVTRPRFLQTFFFDPPEDRAAVQGQVRTTPIIWRRSSRRGN